MVWSKWNAALAVTVAWAGLALGQQSPTPPGAASYLTIQDAAKGPIQCLILRTSVKEDGSQVYQVRTPSGEVLDIYDTQPNAANSSTPSRTPIRTFVQNLVPWGQTPPLNGATPPSPNGTPNPASSSKAPVPATSPTPGNGPATLPPYATPPYALVGTSTNPALVPNNSSAALLPATSNPPYAGAPSVPPANLPTSGKNPFATVAPSPSPTPAQTDAPGTSLLVPNNGSSPPPFHGNASAASEASVPVTTMSSPVNGQPAPVVPEQAYPSLTPNQACPSCTSNPTCPYATSNQSEVFREGEIRTLQEMDGRVVKCRVLKAFHTERGVLACEVQTLDTGEKLTIVENGPVAPVQNAPNGRFRAMAARIFHWGNNNAPPPGAPLPPGFVPESGAVVQGSPMYAGGPTPEGVIFQGSPDQQHLPPPVTLVQNPPQPGGAAPAQPTFLQRVWDFITFKTPETPQVAKAAAPAQAPLSPNTTTPGSLPSTKTEVAQTAPPTPGTLPPPNPGVVKTTPPDKGFDTKTASATDLPGRPKTDSTLPPARVAPLPPLPQLAQSQLDKDKRDDPLARPQNFAPKSVEDKIPPTKTALAPLPPPPPPPTTAALVSSGTPQAPTKSAAGTQGTAAPQSGALPLGSKSVIEAYNGLNSQVKYLPVPIVTVPQPHRPPLPPIPEIPQAPQQNYYINAFTPPPAPNPESNRMQQPMPPTPPMLTPPGMMPPGYPQAMGPGYPPPYGYGYGYGYGPTPQMAQCFYNPAMMNQGPWPRSYQGPMPPNPIVQTGMMPQMPMMPMMPPNYYPPPNGMPYFNPAMDRHAPPTMTAQQSQTADAIEQMVYTLRTSVYPSQREWAANNLALFDWRAQPQIVPALLQAAKQDMAPTVRATCAYNLARLKVTAEPVLAVLQQLKADTDPRVRTEAEKALAQLTPVATNRPAAQVARQPQTQPVQPVQAVTPASPTSLPASQSAVPMPPGLVPPPGR